MAVILLSYAAGAPVHFANQRALVASARRHGGFDRIVPLGEETTPPGEPSPGAGYWLWKPRIILDALEAAVPDDIVVYTDAGATICTPPEPLVSVARAHEGVLFWNDYPNWMHVKRDCFVLTGTDEPRYHQARQLDAAFLLFRNTERVRTFVRLWLGHCTDRRLLTDEPNTCGQPDLPGFRAHRHDQSVLTLLFLRERHGLDFKTFARRTKHRFFRHHRRRTRWLPIWAWHAIHDGGEFMLRDARRGLRVWRRQLWRAIGRRFPRTPARDAFSS